jgi:hypothetical protein
MRRAWAWLWETHYVVSNSKFGDGPVSNFDGLFCLGVFVFSVWLLVHLL